MTEQETSKPQMICGRSYTVSNPVKPQFANHRKVPVKGGARQHVPKPRFLVEGITHKNGALIRFKSLANAERHIRAMGLAKE